MLFKQGKLTAVEKREMDQHAAYTQGILDMIDYPADLWDVPRIAAYHHEKMDGTGPFGIPGDAIPLAARIISVADVFDALLSPRRYKPAMPPLEAFEVLARGCGHDFDASVVAALRSAWDRVLSDVYGMDGIEPPSAAAEDDGDEGLERAA